jgi:peptide/nickel transport system substrate-binding protein
LAGWVIAALRPRRVQGVETKGVAVYKLRTSRHTRRWSAIVACVVLGGLIWGVTSALADSASPSPGKIVINFGWTNDPDSLNPFTGFSSSATELDHLNYDLLVGYDAKTLQPKPELAESWSHDASGKVWTFKLRKGVLWSDGQAFTANDVVWTYKYVMKDSSNYYAGYVTYFTDVKAIDDLTVQITTSKPKGNMLNLWVPILPEHIWSKVDPKTITTSFQNSPPVVGTGPFQVVEYKKSNFTRLVANKHYWRAVPKVDEVIFRTYQDSDTMVQDLKSGALAAIWNVPQAQMVPLSKLTGIKAISYITKGFDDLGFNCYDKPTSLGNPVLRDWRFRQALNWAIDKDQLVKIAYAGFGVPATSIIQSNYYKNPDYHWEPPADVKYTYDPAKAKAALDAAGYKDTNGDGIRDFKGKPISLRLQTISSSPTKQRSGKLITGWLQAIGLKIKFEVMDQEILSGRMLNKTKDGKWAPDYDMFIWDWGGDPDPDFILSVLLGSQIGSWSDTYYNNAEYDRLYLEQQVQLDKNQRKAIIDQMQQIIYKESPYIPLSYVMDLEAYNTAKWTGWVRVPSPNGGVFYVADNIDTYIFVGPKAASTTATGGGMSSGAIAGIIVGAVVVVGAGGLLVLRSRRRGQRAEEEIS